MPYPISGSHAVPSFEVTTPEQAALLSDASAVRHLEPFMGRTLGVAEAARHAGVSTEGMMYRVKQFVRTGLLIQEGVQQRRGRPIRLYAASGAIRVPFHLTPFDDLRAPLEYQGRAFDELRVQKPARSQRFIENRGWLLYRCDETGAVHSETGLNEPSARSTRIGSDFVGTLWLTEELACWNHP